MLTIAAISDTHGGHGNVMLPDADVLIHTGDYCKYGHMSEVRDLAKWMGRLSHKHKVAIAGNHDKAVEERTAEAREIFKAAGVTLLINEGVTIEGVKFWGSPFTPTFFDWSFMLDRGPDIKKIWDQIPDDVDVLLTHGPPYGHGDLCPPYHTQQRKVAGCMDLLIKIREIHQRSNQKHPKLHIFGHIHDGYGATQSDQFPGLTFINASTCTEAYKPTNPPILVELR